MLLQMAFQWTVRSLIVQYFILPVICILAGQFHHFCHKASLYQAIIGAKNNQHLTMGNVEGNNVNVPMGGGVPVDFSSVCHKGP